MTSVTNNSVCSSNCSNKSEGLQSMNPALELCPRVSDTLMYCLGNEGWSKMSEKVPGPVRQAKHIPYRPQAK